MQRSYEPLRRAGSAVAFLAGAGSHIFEEIPQYGRCGHSTAGFLLLHTLHLAIFEHIYTELPQSSK